MRRRRHYLVALLLAFLAWPAPGAAEPAVTLGIVADAFGGQPAPALAALAALAPHGVLVIGDFPHDNPVANCNNAAGCLAKIRAMYDRVYLGTSALGADFKAHILDAGRPFWRANDDHEMRDNVSNNSPWWPEAVQAYAERAGIHQVSVDNGLALGYLYQSLTVPLGDGTAALVMLLDLRSHRETTGAGKTLLGAEQKAWLGAQLARCATDPLLRWCVLVSPVPVNPHQPKLDAWRGYPADTAWLSGTIAGLGLTRVVVVSADCHWGSIALPPDVGLPELNIPQLNAGFSNTCNNGPNQGWTLNSTQAGTGFGLLTLTPTTATLEIRNADGTLRLSAGLAP